MPTEFLSAVVLLTLVVDPFGNTPLVNVMLRRVPAERRQRVVLRECAIAYLILLAFLVAGQSFLALLRLSQPAISIAGGVILFLIALKMVFGGVDLGLPREPAEEPFIVPLATPLIAGPSAVATVMLLALREPLRLAMWAAAVTVTMLLTTVVLLLGARLAHLLGVPAMHAIERLMGLVLTAIAVEMLLGGIRAFVHGLVLPAS